MSHLLGKESLQHLQKLARLRCSESEEQRLQDSLNTILQHMQQLEALDTKHTSACSQVIAYPDNVLRKDSICNGEKGPLLANSPDSIGGMIKIPPVFS